MATKRETGKKGGFALTPITLSQPIKATDGFTNLVETPAPNTEEAKKTLRCLKGREEAAAKTLRQKNRRRKKKSKIHCRSNPRRQ